MSFFEDVFDVFSRRETSEGESRDSPKPLTDSFRNRVLQLCFETFPPPSGGLTGGSQSIWREVYRKLLYRHAVTELSEEPTRGLQADLEIFLRSCEDRHFLDFIEDVCQAENFHRHADEEEFTEAINKFLKVDELPYALTPFQREKRTKQVYGQEREVNWIVERPKIIRRDSQVTHESAVEPALQLLADKRFTSANSEFLEAMEDFRHGDYGDCLTKTCSALESTMKIICDRRGWDYSEDDSAGQLVETVVSKSNLDGYFQQTLIIVATLRNRLSKSHGAGTQEKTVPQHLARYAINTTASNILLLVEECM